MSCQPSSIGDTIGAFHFKRELSQAGLGRYEETLRENGFLGWENVIGITEKDMADMRFRLGDRRKLQRLVREYSTNNIPKPAAITQPPRDQNAPVKPKTAYVLFSEYVRQDPAFDDLPFPEIIEEIGRRWKEIPDEEKQRVWELPAAKRWKEIPDEEKQRVWELPAAKRWKEYEELYELYQRTDDHEKYQRCLEEYERLNSPVRRRISTASHITLYTEVHQEYRTVHQRTASPVNTRSSVFGPEDAVGDTQSLDGDFDISNAQPQDVPGPVEAGLEEVKCISKNLGINFDLIRVAPFPRQETTIRSVETFLKRTGALVFLWDHEQALQLTRSIYWSPSESSPAALVDVFAMATIGSYCDGHPDVAKFSEKFLGYFLYKLSSSPQVGDLHRMRLFACLAICHFTNNTASARRLMSSALEIGRQNFAAELFRIEESTEKQRHWWKVFRSIVFLESWFAYNTHQESRVTHEDLTLYVLPASDNDRTSEMYHQQVFELGRLAAYVALDLKDTTHQPNPKHANQYLDSLTRWHKTLPPPMQLSHISVSNPSAQNWLTKRSLLQLHIVFLGLFMEPYRVCLINLGRSRLGDHTRSIEKERLNALISVEEQCVSAARQSARVASLLQFDSLVRSHCWVSLYTSYVGCVILLYSASQRLLEFNRADVGLELAYASAHIGILAVCSYENTMAERMYTSLQILFNDVRDVLASPDYKDSSHRYGSALRSPMNLPLSQEQTIQSPETLRTNIIDITRRVMDILESNITF